MLKRLLSKFPILTHTRNIIMNQYDKKIEYIIPLYGEVIKDKILYTVKIENNNLKIVYINR